MSDGNHSHAYHLQRRGFDLGEVNIAAQTSDLLRNWQQGKPVLLQGQCRRGLTDQADNILLSEQLYHAILDERDSEDLLDQPPYSLRIPQAFECLGSTINQGDDQEIETVLFDAIDAEGSVAEDLWMKVSWLSFFAEDASLRFRFSFGVDFVEDVAADETRQYYAAELCDKVFPESSIITQNTELLATLQETLGCENINFVERIVYFNAPQGGAYLHHDRERGHAGVVYAQLTGSTFWLALNKQALMQEIVDFVEKHDLSLLQKPIDSDSKQELEQLASNTEQLASELETFANSTLIHLINETPEFVLQLVEHGHGRQLNTGDVLLLPQQGEMDCCWHSVFCTSDTAGQALSFAIRTN